MANNAIMLKGIVELLIFQILDDQEEIYAFELSGLISEYSKGLIQVQHPTLYPTLYRMKDRGYISIEEKIVGNRKRNYYKMRDLGHERYEKIKRDYEVINEGMHNVLAHSKGRKG
jgi:DNA-binding PadR family transcriptional regulator